MNVSDIVAIGMECREDFADYERRDQIVIDVALTYVYWYGPGGSRMRRQ